MGARFKENLTEVTDDYSAFYTRTGMLGYLSLELLGFRISNYGGIVPSEQVEEAREFCVQNPDYHILTMTGDGYYENRYVPSHRVYFLGNGDANPFLALNLFLRKNRELFQEEGLAKAFAIIAQVDGGDESE